MPTQEQVLDALKKVKFPGLSRDIVSFGFVHDVRVQDGVTKGAARAMVASGRTSPRGRGRCGTRDG